MSFVCQVSDLLTSWPRSRFSLSYSLSVFNITSSIISVSAIWASNSYSCPTCIASSFILLTLCEEIIINYYWNSDMPSSSRFKHLCDDCGYLLTATAVALPVQVSTTRRANCNQSVQLLYPVSTAIRLPSSRVASSYVRPLITRATRKKSPLRQLHLRRKIVSFIYTRIRLHLLVAVIRQDRWIRWVTWHDTEAEWMNN